MRGMRLKIKNLAVIKDADIQFDGITVIAGENNTGKSTVGKVLFALFHSFYQMEEEVQKRRWDAIAHRVALLINDVDESPNGTFLFGSIRHRLSRYLYESFAGKDSIDEETCLSKIQFFFHQHHYVDEKVFLSLRNEIQQVVHKIYSYSNQEIQNMILTNAFKKIFFEQSNSLIHDVSAEVLLQVKAKNIAVKVLAEKCVESSSMIRLQHDATYIENPFIMDMLDNRMAFSKESLMTSDLKNKLDRQRHGIDTISQRIREEYLHDVVACMQRAICGSFVEKGRILSFHQEGIGGDILVKNLSTGVKAFAILKRLLELYNLNEQDVLILDEPEIHLHPEWQLVYAELIVLLQKTFNLTILLTTHSPYFLEAIEVFSEMHGVKDKTKYYLAHMQGQEATFHDVTDDTSKIYQLLAAPFDKLDELRREKGGC